MIAPDDAVPQEGCSVRMALARAISQLKDSSPSPVLDARLLLAFILETSADRLVLVQEEMLGPDQLIAFHALLERRLKHEPVAYLIGKKDFWTFSLDVSKHTLIPRPDTEILVETILKCQPDHDPRPRRVLDLGTGTGALILALLSELPSWTGLATDISSEALTVAQKNAAKLGLEDRLSFKQGSWFEALSADDGPFDIIVSNPPYIRPDHIAGLAEDVRVYEPILALDGGPDGLSAYRTIIGSASNWLIPKGILVLEIGFDQAETVGTIARSAFETVDIKTDLAGNPRCVILFDGVIA